LVLVTTYADGRTVHSVISGTARTAWTPVFPRVAGYKPSGTDLLVTAIKYRQVLRDDGTASVAVSVLRGQSHEQEQPVATVVVIPGVPSTVDALRSIGVAPIVLALAPLAPTTLYQPRVLNRTAGLDVVNIEVVVDPVPRYEISVRNVSSQPAVNFHVVTYREDQRSLSGNRGNADASAIIAPQDVYSFTLPPAGGPPGASGQWAPASHDTVEIAAVLWEDGTVDGDPAPMALALSTYLGRATQLARAIAILETMRPGRNPAAARAALQAQLKRLSIEPDEDTRAILRNRLRHFQGIDETPAIGALRYALTSARTGILEDVTAAPDDGPQFDRWVREILALYQTWHSRLANR
jgi:hypothetical protein